MLLPEESQVAVAEADPGKSLDAVISVADSFIRRQYLTQLKDAQIVPLVGKASLKKMGRNVRMFKIESLSYGETDDLYGKMANVFNAVVEFDAGQVIILDSDGFRISLYLGIACEEADRLSMEFQTFKGSFLGNFPGAKIAMMNMAKNEELLGSIFDEENIKISSVSALAAAKEDSGDHRYAIEQFVDGMYGKPFTMLLLSEAAPKEELRGLRQSLEAMYTELSPFQEYTVSINESRARGKTQSWNVTKSASRSEAESVTETASFGKSENRSSTMVQSGEAQERAAKNQLTGTALSLAAILTGFGAGEALHPLQGLFYGNSVSNVIGSAQLLLAGAEPGRTETTGESENYNAGISEGQTITYQHGVSETEGASGSRTETAGQTIQMRYENKSVRDLLEVIREQLVRLRHIEETGGFTCAAYFVTGDNATALTAANMYRSLLSGRGSLGQNNAVNLWADPEKVADICEYLRRLRHPLFHFESRPGYPSFTAGTLVAVREIPMYASLPQKSMGGLPVARRAEFARDVIRMETDSSDEIDVGTIFHMGKTGTGKVSLSVQDLSGHMFVAGTTGMGKSNFCYGLLDGLCGKNIRFLVIEPAKGEYRHVFGGRSDVHTFGTNQNLAPLLKIDPFSFPEDIHVNEHISRLLEIFNSCWPMYAAMPEVLKEGLEAIYRKCGFHLVTGQIRGTRRFPTFADLLAALPEIIHRSDFSSEVKGNYIGSLVTRVRSLTDGLYGCIFTGDEISPQTLFDENVLIDLSRVGSGETKALIMGILVMKLQEYRMCSAKMNTPLSHVTVLEEAHHLLRAATTSSAEGVSLRAMSLEMITNAIAEMRTYGEGFLIADQSPAMMDLSVIRNTNTKVVFKLPENSDRLAVGNAMSLSESQMREVARLERGVAVVSQAGWDNAVLARINHFDSSRFQPYVHTMTEPGCRDTEVHSQCLAVLLKDRLPEGAASSVNADVCEGLLRESAYDDGGLKESFAVIEHYVRTGNSAFSFAEICRCTDRIVDTRKFMETCGNADALEAWERRAYDYLDFLPGLTEDEKRELIALCINIRVSDSEAMKKLYYRHAAYHRCNM